MKSFELKINDENSIYANVEWGSLVVAIHIEDSSQEAQISMVGVESDAYHIKWTNRKLKVGDRIKVAVLDIETLSPPLSIVKIDRENMKQRYLELKKELEKTGIIK